MIEVYRLHSSRYLAHDGKGAALYGGRWNRPGTEVLYTAQSRSLAILEVLVHYAVLPRDFLLTPIRIPAQVRVLSVPQDLAERLYPHTAVLSVPSAIVASERNYILHPPHPDFRHIHFLPPEPFPFDPRLKP